LPLPELEDPPELEEPELHPAREPTATHVAINTAANFFIFFIINTLLQFCVSPIKTIVHIRKTFAFIIADNCKLAI
jgi:hypothetical protein